MSDELFNSEPFAQIRGQMDFTYDGEPLWSPETVSEWEPQCGRDYCRLAECCSCDIGDEPDSIGWTHGR